MSHHRPPANPPATGIMCLPGKGHAWKELTTNDGWICTRCKARIHEGRTNST